MLELIIRTHVAERENAAGGGALILVDGDATVAHLDTRQLRVEQIAVGNPAGRDQDGVAVHRRAVVHCQGDARAVLARPDHVAVVVNLPLLRRDVGEPLAHRVVGVPQQRAAANDQRDPRAERREGVRELRGDEPAADDDEMLWQFADSHDGVAGVVVDTAVPDRIRHHRTRARGDHHLIRGELVTAIGVQRVAAIGLRGPEAGMGLEDRDVR